MLDPAGSNAFSFLTPPLCSLCLALAVLVFADLDVLKLIFLLVPDSRQGYWVAGVIAVCDCQLLKSFALGCGLVTH